ncbi:imidazole glycerol phosphate synthase cyclase subunit [Alphaproteobacteria bacterium]|nr:imidazole glycerol phosphate synthase cyclase subunit [Alphaproteobacteria bacterium]
MLKTRIIPTMLFKENGLVKDQKFASMRRVGGALQAIKVYGLREVDELVYLDVAATRSGNPPDFALIDELADECFMPFTVGGGIRDVQDIRQLLMVGADKVVINTAAIDSPTLIGECSRQFGSQCIVVSIDVSRGLDGTPKVFSHSGTEPTGLDPVLWGREVEARGAGEILLTSIDQDGMMQGYDVPLVKAVTEAVSIPVIASGGAGRYADMATVLHETSATAVAAASMFQFTEQTPLEAKRFLQDQGFPVRL